MQTWSITLHGPSGIISTVDTGESQFVIGTETASDVFMVNGDGVAARHAWVWISEAGVQVEDLGGGTLVNGYQITERVQVEYPASVQVGEVTLVIEVKAVQAVAVSPTPSSLDITIPQRAVTKTKASMEVTIPQRTPTRGNVQKTASTGTPSAQPSSTSKASPTCEYTLVREIARGGMGQIYFGEDPQLKRNVAVKVSSVSEGGEDPRFSKEAEVLAQLAHPNIVPIYNIGVDAQSRPFYSMKLIKGRTLQAVLNLIRDGDAAAIKDYPRATLLTIFRKVCDAMMFAHSKGILHRDLKPENIMVGEYGEVLVMDWGLAKVLGEREEQGSVSRVNDTGDYGMTMEGEVMGTPQYMSPEQAMGMVAELDTRSDIYSLGGILYAILTLRPPIEGTTLDEVLTKVKNGSISSMVTKRGGKGAVTVGAPNAMGAEVPEALQAVTLKAMATDRNKRYASVELFAGDIERYQNGFATQAEEAGAMKQLVLFIKRNKGVSASVVLFVIAAAAFTAKLAASERIAKMNERRAVAAAEKSRREEAHTSLMLAESCLETGDMEGMENALLAIPEDFRTPTWRYLAAKMDRCDREFISTGTTQWVGVENHPTDPNLFVALQSNGAFCTLNPVNGEMTELWTAECVGRTVIKFALSSDGTRTAVAFRRKNALEIEVFDLDSGEKKGVLIQSNDALEISELQISKQFILLRFVQQSAEIARCLCWDSETGQPLWEKPYLVGARFSKSGTEVFGADLNHNYVRLEAQTGQELESSKRLLAFPDSGFPNAFFWGPNEMVLGPQNFPQGARLVKTVVGAKSAEFSLKIGNKMIAVTAIPQNSMFGTIVRTGSNSLLLELRHMLFGDLLQAFPMRGRLLLSGDSFTSVRGNTNFIAIVLNDSRRRIRLFDLRKTPPLHGGSIAKDRGHSIWLGEGSQVLSVSKIRTEEGKRSSYLFEKMDYEAKPSGSVSTALMKIHDKGGYDVYIAGRQANNWIVYGADNTLLCGASLGPEGLRERWVSSVGNSSSNFAIHPTRDEIFFGPRLLDLKTGKEIQLIDYQGLRSKTYRDLKRPPSHIAVWVGDDRVLEPVEWGTQSNEKSGPQQSVMLALWNVRTGGLDVSVDAPYVAVVAASPDGASVLEGGVDKRMRIRNGRTLAIESESRVHDQSVSGVAWHPTKPLVASASSDGTLRIWNRMDWSLVEEFRTGDTNPWDVQISPSGKRLLAMRFRSEVRVFEPKSFQD